MAATALTLGLGAWWALGLQAAPSPEVVDAQRGQVRTLEAELTGIDQQASAAAGAHAEAQRRVADLRERIAETVVSLRETRAAHAVAVQRLSDRLVAIYTGEPPPSLVEVLLTSGGLSDAIQAQGALEAIGDADAAIVSSLEAQPRPAHPPRVRAADEPRGGRGQPGRGRVPDGRASEPAERPAGRARPRPRQPRRPAGPAIAERGGPARQPQGGGGGRRPRRGGPAAPGGSGTAPAAPAPSAPAAAPEATTSTPGTSVAAALERIAQCESGGNPRAVSSNGLYFGKYQFSLGTWQGVGGQGNPAEAPEEEQDRRAAILYAQSGPAPWPVCGYQ